VNPAALPLIVSSIWPLVAGVFSAILLALTLAASIPEVRATPHVLAGVALAALPCVLLAQPGQCVPTLPGLCAAVVVMTLCAGVVHAGVAVATGSTADDPQLSASARILRALICSWLLLQSTIPEDSIALSTGALCTDSSSVGHWNTALHAAIRLVPSLLAFRLALDAISSGLHLTIDSPAARPAAEVSRIAPAILVLWLIQHPEQILADAGAAWPLSLGFQP
jgi:hypothetical protein